MSLADEVKSRLDIVELISGYVPLTKAGRSYKGLCPFHPEKAPSFFVFPHTQTWHCFGACSEGGDVFTFLMKVESLEFREALRALAQKAGVQLNEFSRDDAGKQRLDALRAVNAVAVSYFHHWLRNSEKGAVARNYMQSRGFTDETMEAFQLGYAPEGRQGLLEYLRGKGIELERMVEAGLVLEKDGTYHDRFWGRLMIPIADYDGNTIGFSGRVLDNAEPKYMNSPQTALFDKGANLFGIDRAKRTIRAKDQAVIVEGYTDVMMAHQKGRNNVVASMGTALSARQFEKLKRLAKRFILAFDADAAGQQAVERVLEVAWESLDRRYLPVRLRGKRARIDSEVDAELRALALPEGKDPDEIICRDADEWDWLVEGAPLAMDYVFERVLSQLDLDSPVGKSAAVERLLPLVAKIGNRVQQAHYIQELARAARVQEKDLLRRLSHTSEGAAPERRLGAQGSESGSREAVSTEEYFLGLLASWPRHYREALGVVPEFFSGVENRALFEGICLDLRSGHDLTSLEEVRGRLVAPLSEHLDKILQEVGKWLPASSDGDPDDLESRALDLARRYWIRRQQELQFVVDETTDPDEKRAYKKLAARCGSELNRIARQQYRRTPKGRREVQDAPAEGASLR